MNKESVEAVTLRIATRIADYVAPKMQHISMSEVRRYSAVLRSHMVDIITEELTALPDDDVRSALQTLVTKLDSLVNDDTYMGVWLLWTTHCGAYDGPTYDAELKAAKKALNSWRATNGDKDIG